MAKKGQVDIISYISGAIILIGGASYFFGQGGWGAVIVGLAVFIELLSRKLLEVLK